MTVQNSVPTPIVPVMDFPAPDTKKFKAKFFYNYYVKDEATNDLGRVPDELSSIPGEEITNKQLNKFSTQIPRFVRLDFAPASHTSYETLARRTLERSADKFVNDLGVTKNGFVPLDLQDTNVRDKLYTLVEKAYEREVRRNNDSVEKNIEKAKKDLNEVMAKSQTDKAKALNRVSRADANFISDALNNLERAGQAYVSPDSRADMTKRSFQAAQELSVRTRVNAKFLDSVVNSTINDPLSLFAEELIPLKKRSEEIQDAAITNFSSLRLGPRNFRQTFPSPFSLRNVSSSNYDTNFSIVGYVIDKRELLDSGAYIQHDPIVIPFPKASSYVDFKIKYGTTYSYAIRTVISLKLLRTSRGTNQYVVRSMLMTSRPTSRRTFVCHEPVPPPPVGDLTVTYSYSKKGSRLMWNMPTNPQRDIVKFQIFRRRTIEESFTLINVLDFDNSDVRFVGREIINPDVVTRITQPATLFIDQEFDKNESYIYAIACVDAHGQSSNYSNQIQVSFDVEKNRINSRRISRSGAPRQYPNFYIKQTLFKQTISTSEAKRIKIYFDPEYLDVDQSLKRLGSESVDEQSLLTNEEKGKYILQLLNTDLQQSKSIDILIKDLRT
tara:strand:- start:1348 stop:3177 length:1830 start_codon:yes stop_codon:yes gene_type:complete